MSSAVRCWPIAKDGHVRLTQHTSRIVRFARTDPVIHRHIRILCADDSDPATRGILVQIPHACAAPGQQVVKSVKSAAILCCRPCLRQKRIGACNPIEMGPTRGCRLLAVTACIAVFLAAPSAAQITFPATSSGAAAAPAAAMPTAVVNVDPFSTIQVCAPVNILIVPSNSTNYTVSGQADPGVLQSLIPVVANGTLQLQTSGNFTTNNIVSLQVIAATLVSRMCRYHKQLLQSAAGERLLF